MGKPWENLDRLIRERGHSNASVGLSLGVSDETIRRWRKGIGGPTLIQIASLCTLLNVSTDDLLGISKPSSASPHELTEDERFVLRTFHVLGLTAEEAVRRMACHCIHGPKR